MRLYKSLYKILLKGAISLCLLGIQLPESSHKQVQAQPQPNVNITFNAQVIDVDVFYVGDVIFNLQDLMTSPQGPIFFSINVTSDQAANVMFGIEFTADTDVVQGDVELFSGLTHPIRIEAGQPKFFTSRDLAQGGRLEMFSAETIDLSRQSGPAQKIVEAIRATSRVPDGIYNITFTVYHTESDSEPYQPRSLVFGPQSIQLEIRNPTRVELLSPMDGDRIVTQFPHFQWRSDTRDVVVRVFEMRPGIRSPEEAITGIPHLEKRVTGNNQLTYPSTGADARPLEPGKQYIWYLEGVYRTSANREEAIISELHTFTVIDPSQEGRYNILWSELKQLLEDEHPHIVEEIEQGNFEHIEARFLDGAQITTEELQMIINAIRAGVNNPEILNVSIQE